MMNLSFEVHESAAKQGTTSKGTQQGYVPHTSSNVKRQYSC